MTVRSLRGGATRSRHSRRAVVSPFSATSMHLRVSASASPSSSFSAASVALLRAPLGRPGLPSSKGRPRVAFAFLRIEPHTDTPPPSGRLRHLDGWHSIAHGGHRTRFAVFRGASRPFKRLRRLRATRALQTGYRDRAAIPFLLRPGAEPAVKRPPTRRRTEPLVFSAGPSLEARAAPLACARCFRRRRFGSLLAQRWCLPGHHATVGIVGSDSGATRLALPAPERRFFGRRPVMRMRAASASSAHRVCASRSFS